MNSPERCELDKAFDAFTKESTPKNYEWLTAAREAYNQTLGMSPEVTREKSDLFNMGANARRIYASRRF
jgi:hypothetical protein